MVVLSIVENTDMINSIIDLFRCQAREHKTIRSFYYNRNYELGTGNEKHPLLWLEDPITGRNQQNVFVNTVNFSVLFVPNENDNITDLQNLAFSTGLNILERIKLNSENQVSVLPDWSYMTLRNYYDNNACGCRFTVNLIQRNMQDLCLIEEQFDANKQLEENSFLNNFEITLSHGCETFVKKLPVFDLKTNKR
jgi:hypothetical protein